MNVVPAPRRFVVIGANGFIGRRLIARLSAGGASVRAAGLPGAGRPESSDWVNCDVRDPASLRGALAGIDVAYNLAGVHGPGLKSRDHYAAVNVGGARNVCDAATACGVGRIVFTSTADVYGPVSGADETAFPRPDAEYGRSKVAAEAIYRGWAAERSDRSLVIVRPTVVFGPGGHGPADRFIQHVAGPHFALYGPAGQRRSLAYVENVAAFLAAAGGMAPGIHTYNYADTPDLTVADIAAAVRTALGLPPARRRSRLHGIAAAISATIKNRLGLGPVSPGVPVRGLIVRVGVERRLDARRAHCSGFVPPVALLEALAHTARANAAWIALLSRPRA